MTSSAYTACLSTLSGVPNRIAILPDAIYSVQCQRWKQRNFTNAPQSWSAVSSKTIQIVFRMGIVHSGHLLPPLQNDQPKNNTSLRHQRDINCWIGMMKLYRVYEINSLRFLTLVGFRIQGFYTWSRRYDIYTSTYLLVR